MLHAHKPPPEGKPATPSEPADLEKLILKLRWIGLEDEAIRLCSQLARIAPGGGPALWPRDTD